MAIQFQIFILDNGLTVIIHTDPTTPFITYNTLYKVGSRNEHPDHTGLAHLFEHLMFGGSKHAANFDYYLNMTGGENNAFTSNDLTNYYDTIPLQNIETCAWLESDRMGWLDLTDKVIEVQRKVVCEEFKEHYINQPYGDVWHILLPLCYQIHPYHHPTIGKELSHIYEATRDIIIQFYNKHYAPNNAIITIGGNITSAEIMPLIKKYYDEIPQIKTDTTPIIKEQIQTHSRRLKHNTDVPVNILYMAYPICDRLHDDYYTTDLITDVLGYGHASHLYQTMVKDKKMCSEIDCYHTGTMDEGIVVVEAKLKDYTSFEQAEEEVHTIISSLIKTGTTDYELQRSINKIEAQHAFAYQHVLNRCIDLCYFEMLGDAEMINKELDKYQKVNRERSKIVAQSIFDTNKANILYYGKC